MPISITVDVNNCQSDTNIYTCTLASTAVLGGDHVAVIDFVGPQDIYSRALTWKVAGVAVNRQQAFLFTEAGESYELECIVNKLYIALEEPELKVILPYTVDAIYTPSWATLTGEIVVTLSVQECPAGLIFVPTECPGTGAPSVGNKYVVYSDNFPTGLTLVQRQGTLYHSLGTLAVTLVYDNTFCSADAPNIRPYPTQSKGNAVLRVSIPEAAVPEQLVFPSMPDGGLVYDLTSAPSRQCMFAGFGKPAICEFIASARTSPIISMSASGNISARPNCPGEDTIVENMDNTVKFYSTTTIAGTGVPQWLQQEFTYTVTETFSSSLGVDASIAMTITKVACEATASATAECTITIIPPSTTITPHKPDEYYRDTVPKNYEIGILDYLLRLNLTFSASDSFLGHSCYLGGGLSKRSRQRSGSFMGAFQFRIKS